MRLQTQPASEAATRTRVDSPLRMGYAARGRTQPAASSPERATKSGSEPGRAASRLAWTFLLVGLSATGAYLVLPTPGREALYSSLDASMIAALIIGIRRNRPPRARGWLLIAAGVIAFSLGGDLPWIASSAGLLPPVGFPSYHDAAWLGGYLVMAAGVAFLIFDSTGEERSGSLIEALAVTGGLSALSWVFLIHPNLFGGGVTFLARATAVAYPVVDLMFGALIARLLFASRGRTPSHWFLILALGATLVSDTLFSVASNRGAVVGPGSPVVLGWLVFYVFIGTSALHPSMRFSDRTPSSGERRIGPTLALLGSISSIPVWLMLFGHPEGQVEVALAVITLGLFSLFVIRLGLLFGRQKLAEAALRDEAEQRRRTEVELAESLEALQATNAERRRLLRKLVHLQEEERREIAADIHDDSIQVMTGVGLRLATLKRKGGAASGRDELAELETAVQDAIGRLRRLMFNVRPAILDGGGLEQALRLYLRQVLGPIGVRFDIHTELSQEPPGELRVIAYRIVQEAVNNVRKHAGDSAVEVHIARVARGLQVRVADDGVGFSVSEGDRGPEHLGLAAMRERAELAGGRCEIRSAPGSGTTVEFWLPWRTEVAPIPLRGEETA
jgi:signal transduction histidine kinase